MISALFDTSIEEAIVLYGESFISHNHGLQYVASDVRNYGYLENFLCFKYENFLQIMKSLIRSGNQPLKQVVSRYQELLSVHEVQNVILKKIIKNSRDSNLINY